MNHAITIGGLLTALTIVAGVAMTGFGCLMVFAGGMSDAPSEGSAYSKHGCILAVVGIALVVVCLVGLVA